MMNKFYVLLAVCVVLGASATAQTPESFFPHHVGDRWEYVETNYPGVLSMTLSRDSVGTDSSHNLFYNGFLQYPVYRIDIAENVFKYPQIPNYNYLRYKLTVDSCDSWENPQWGAIRWAWVARVESAIVFSRRTVIKVTKYAPGNPCGLGSLEEDWLASGFGLIYTYREPNEISYLRGCVIAGDTFGILTSATREEQPISNEFILSQNYPNPFNPSTTITLSLPERSRISLKVFDLLGREIEEVADGNYNAGTHKFVWDASSHATGVYYCRMHANGSVQTIKMLLMR